MASAARAGVWRTLDWAERDRFVLLTLVAWILLVASSRVLIEKALLDGDGLLPSSGQYLCRQYADPWSEDCAFVGTFAAWTSLDSVYVVAFQVAAYVVAFLGIALVLHVATRQPPGRTLQVAAVGFPLLLLAPFLDRYLFSALPASYTCVDVLGNVGPTTSMACYLTPFTDAAMPAGLRVEGILLLAFVAVYAWSRTHSAPRTLGAAVGAYLLWAVIGLGASGALQAYWECAGVAGGGCASAVVLGFVSLLVASGVLIALLVDRGNPRILPFLARTPHLVLAAVPAGAALFGVFLGPRLAFDRSDDWPFLGLLLLSALASWAGAAVSLDAWAHRGSRKVPLRRRRRKGLALTLGVVAFGLAAPLGPASLLVAAAAGLASWVTVYVLRVPDAFARNVPWVYALFFVLVGYFAVNPGLPGGTAFLPLGTYVIEVPSSSLSGGSLLTLAALILLLAPLLITLWRDRLLTRSSRAG